MYHTWSHSTELLSSYTLKLKRRLIKTQPLITKTMSHCRLVFFPVLFRQPHERYCKMLLQYQRKYKLRLLSRQVLSG